MSDIVIESAEKLAASYSAPSETNRGEGVLFIHGWRSSRHTPDRYASHLARLGYTCLTFDLPGMGDSTGNLHSITREDFLLACNDAYDYLAENSNGAAIHVAGSSFGSYLACLLSAERQVASLALRVPADFPDDIPNEADGALADGIDQRLGSLPTLSDPPTRAQEALERFQGPVMIVESELDDVVPSTTVARFVRSSTDAEHILMPAPHSLQDDDQHRSYQQHLERFLLNE